MIHPVKYQPIRFFPSTLPAAPSLDLKIPTEDEWDAERLSWSSNNSTGAFNSPLKLTLGGRRDISDGSINQLDNTGYYWSSNIDGTLSTFLDLSTSNAAFGDFWRSSGRSVRLIAEGVFTQGEFDDNYEGETIEIDGITYGYAYNPTTERIWLDRNLGATQVATSATDSDAYGWLFQWGRLADGHQLRDSSTTATLSSGDVPGNSDFITVNTFPNDWRDPQNDDLWQGVNGINVPK